MRRALPAFVLVLVLAAAVAAQAPTRAGEIRARGIDAAYELDYDRAGELLEKAAALAPGDAATHRALAARAWVQIQFTRGAVTVDDYLGGLSRAQVVLRRPPADLAAAFRQHIARALEIAEPRVRARPTDVDALYDYGAAIGLEALYTATVEGKVLAGFRAARRAYDAHERVLELDPSRKDAGLVVGTYRYIVGLMSLPMRLLAYVAGFGGDKARGLQMIEAAAAYPGISQVEAQFALVLLYNRERRYDEALRVLSALRDRYPRNRLLWLESGATALRAGRAAEAERWLTDGIARLARDGRPRMFGEEALWYCKRGIARLHLGRADEARADLRAALAREGRGWVHGRAHLALGQLADVAGDREGARREYALAIPLAERDNDPATARAARRFARRPYAGR